MALYNLLTYIIAMAAFSLVNLAIHSIVSTEESLTLHVLTLSRLKTVFRVNIAAILVANAKSNFPRGKNRLC